MAFDTPQEITVLLRAWSRGDERALERLVPLVDVELRRISKQYLRRTHRGATLTTTDLVNEAYVRLIEAKPSCQDRVHFFALCARVMRGILVDHARAHQSAKRGGAALRVPLDQDLAVSREAASDLVAIDEALSALSNVDERKAQVVELRFFGGLTVDETAEVLTVSPETVMRDWRLAKAWLMRELTRGASHGRGELGN